MPTVLIVEDEPAAGRYLRSMIELKRPEFVVAGVAENGRVALESIRACCPDLVITDVKMPVMDGIELAAALKREFPQLPAIIVSGHQEFEYARRALDTGVVDYLLKPVGASKLSEVLDRVSPAIASRAAGRRSATILRLLRGECLDAADERAVAADELFWLAVVRSGGLPSRFRFEGEVSGPPSLDGSICSLPGRDARERIYLGPKGSLAFDEFSAAISAAAEGAGSFRTVLIRSETVCAGALREAVREACLDADSLIVVGEARLRHGACRRLPLPEWDRVAADRVEYALREGRSDLLERAVRDAAARWESERLPLVSVEIQLRRILQFVLRKSPRPNDSVAGNLEYLLDDALSRAADFGGIADATWNLVAAASGATKGNFRDTDVPAFFCAIERYVEERYADPLSVGSLSATFRISPSYLSKLFRQHAGRSFGEFLTAARIDAAKRLIRESPGIPLKDVAECSGFADPFYFSRVFKSVVGSAPSEYAKRAAEKEALPPSAGPD